MLIQASSIAPSAPGAGKGLIYFDSTDKTWRTLDDGNTNRRVAQDGLYSRTADSAAINTTETIIAGGMNNAQIKANQLKVGTVIRATLQGTCTSTVANASTWRAHIGTAGTTADGIAAQAANSIAAASGTNIPFELIMVLTCRTIGAAANFAGHITLSNTGVTGVSAVNVQVVEITPTNFNSTVDNWLSFTYVSAAVTTTCTFKQGVIEIPKL